MVSLRILKQIEEAAKKPERRGLIIRWRRMKLKEAPHGIKGSRQAK